MTVERVLAARREKIIDHCQAGRRKPEPDDVMDEEAVERCAVDPGYLLRVRQDHPAQDEVHQGPDQRGRCVPHGHVEPPLIPQPDRPQHLHGDKPQYHKPENVQGPLILPRFKP